LMTKALDLCDKCEQLYTKIQIINDIKAKQRLYTEFELHNAAAM
ncbi:480_t:CDS:1, partial [Cetraspora pellucida]